MSGDPIRDGIQAYLDATGDGWTVRDYVVVVGVEDLRGGEVHTATWWHTPPETADYVVDGLLLMVDWLRSDLQAEDEI